MQHQIFQCYGISPFVTKFDTKCAEVRARIKFPAAPKRGGEKVKMSCLHIPGSVVKPRFAADKKPKERTAEDKALKKQKKKVEKQKKKVDKLQRLKAAAATGTLTKRQKKSLKALQRNQEQQLNSSSHAANS